MKALLITCVFLSLNLNAAKWAKVSNDGFTCSEFDANVPEVCRNTMYSTQYYEISCEGRGYLTKQQGSTEGIVSGCAPLSSVTVTYVQYNTLRKPECECIEAQCYNVDGSVRSVTYDNVEYKTYGNFPNVWEAALRTVLCVTAGDCQGTNQGPTLPWSFCAKDAAAYSVGAGFDMSPYQHYFAFPFNGIHKPEFPTCTPLEKKFSVIHDGKCYEMCVDDRAANVGDSAIQECLTGIGYTEQSCVDQHYTTATGSDTSYNMCYARDILEMSGTRPELRGCTNALASNYDELATEDDGSCSKLENSFQSLRS